MSFTFLFIIDISSNISVRFLFIYFTFRVSRPRNNIFHVLIALQLNDLVILHYVIEMHVL